MDDDELIDKLMNMILWDLLKAHREHHVEIVCYGDPSDPSDVRLECMDCNEVLLDAGIFTICTRED